MLVSQNALRLLPYRLRKMLDLRTRVNVGGREVVIPTWLDDSFQHLRWEPSWRTELFARLVDPGAGAFLDVGANIGQTLLDLLAAAPGAEYYGFEPNPVCVRYVEDLIRVNGCERHSIISVGLSDEARLLTLYTFDNPSDSAGTLVEGLRLEGRQRPAGCVPCFPFDEVAQGLGVGRIGFVKIDVEGGELGAARGMRASLARWRPRVLCEVLTSDPSPEHLARNAARGRELMALLRELEYTVRRVVKSADEAHVVGVPPVDEFPEAYWTEETRHDCDYLFIPREAEEATLGALSRAHAGLKTD